MCTNNLLYYNNFFIPANIKIENTYITLYLLYYNKR